MFFCFSFFFFFFLFCQPPIHEATCPSQIKQQKRTKKQKKTQKKHKKNIIKPNIKLFYTDPVATLGFSFINLFSILYFSFYFFFLYFVFFFCYSQFYLSGQSNPN
eukprot:Trichotokara_eunicae@DN9371_c0_g1_i1.p1